MNMKTRLASAAVILAASVGSVVSGAGTADAYPVGPWKIQGPCAGKSQAQCAMQPSPDGLTWSFHGDAWNYDKTGRFVCMSSAFYCEPLMVVVRALPPVAIGR